MIDANQPAVPLPGFLPTEVVDEDGVGVLEEGHGVREAADIGAEADTEVLYDLVPFTVASLVGLAWGNLVLTGHIVDRRGLEDGS